MRLDHFTNFNFCDLKGSTEYSKFDNSRKIPIWYLTSTVILRHVYKVNSLTEINQANKNATFVGRKP